MFCMRYKQVFFQQNVDGATSEKRRKSSIEVIIRDYKGEAVASLCKLLPETLPWWKLKPWQ